VPLEIMMEWPRDRRGHSVALPLIASAKVDRDQVVPDDGMVRRQHPETESRLRLREPQ
jgi:hypothetical protein